MHKSFQKITDLLGTDGPFNHHESQMTFGTNCSYHIEAELCSCAPNNRSFSFQRPSFARVKIRPDSRFIFKINARPNLFGILLFFKAGRCTDTIRSLAKTWIQSYASMVEKGGRLKTIGCQMNVLLWRKEKICQVCESGPCLTLGYEFTKHVLVLIFQKLNNQINT